MADAPAPAPTRRDRRKLELRMRVVAEAKVLFDVQGVHATTVGEICERADIAQKTFFNHFASKQHLLRELAVASLDELLEMLDGVRKEPGLDGRQRLHRFFAHFALRAEAAGPMHRELLTELIHAMHDEPDATRVDGADESDETNESQRVRRLHDAFGAWVRDGIDAGDFTRAHAPDALAELVLGAFYSLMFNHAHRDDYALRENAAAAARLLCDSIKAPGGEPCLHE